MKPLAPRATDAAGPGRVRITVKSSPVVSSHLTDRYILRVFILLPPNCWSTPLEPGGSGLKSSNHRLDKNDGETHHIHSSNAGPGFKWHLSFDLRGMSLGRTMGHALPASPAEDGGQSSEAPGAARHDSPRSVASGRKGRLAPADHAAYLTGVGLVSSTRPALMPPENSVKMPETG